MTMTTSGKASDQLAQGFKPRHVTMLSIAGVIGADLFVAVSYTHLTLPTIYSV